MATAPDRRVRRTRKALQEALLALMIDKGYEAITVQDIIDRADVGRSTFYTHYTDREDLLQDCFADLRSILDQSAPAMRGGRRVLAFSLALFRHIHEQQRLARALFTQPDRTPVLRQVEQLLAEAVRAELPAQSPSDRPRVPPEALVRHIVGSFLSLLKWWLSVDPPAPPEEIDRIFHALVVPGIRSATHNMQRPRG